MCYTGPANSLIVRKLIAPFVRIERTRLVLASCVVSFLANVIAISEAAAGLYKCAGVDGIPVYQEAPCPKGSELRNLNTDPPNLSVVPAPKPAPYPQAEREKPARQASARRVD